MEKTGQAVEGIIQLLFVTLVLIIFIFVISPVIYDIDPTAGIFAAVCFFIILIGVVMAVFRNLGRW
jgi:hypothetical protein